MRRACSVSNKKEDEKLNNEKIKNETVEKEIITEKKDAY
jgi:hypothetical protein